MRSAGSWLQGCRRSPRASATTPQQVAVARRSFAGTVALVSIDMSHNRLTGFPLHGSDCGDAAELGRGGASDGHRDSSGS